MLSYFFRFEKSNQTEDELTKKANALAVFKLEDFSRMRILFDELIDNLAGNDTGFRAKVSIFIKTMLEKPTTFIKKEFFRNSLESFIAECKISISDIVLSGWYRKFVEFCFAGRLESLPKDIYELGEIQAFRRNLNEDKSLNQHQINSQLKELCKIQEIKQYFLSGSLYVFLNNLHGYESVSKNAFYDHKNLNKDYFKDPVITSVSATKRHNLKRSGKFGSCANTSLVLKNKTDNTGGKAQSIYDFMRELSAN